MLSSFMSCEIFYKFQVCSGIVWRSNSHNGKCYKPCRIARMKEEAYPTMEFYVYQKWMLNLWLEVKIGFVCRKFGFIGKISRLCWKLLNQLNLTMSFKGSLLATDFYRSLRSARWQNVHISFRFKSGNKSFGTTRPRCRIINAAQIQFLLSINFRKRVSTLLVFFLSKRKEETF